MADPVKEGAGKAAGKAGSFLTRKIGPLPMWVWLAAGLGIYLYFQHQQAATAATAATNQQTDPAGNVGSIDPATGYVFGTPEDLAALAADNGGTSTDSGTAGQSGTSGGQTYADNNSWGIAAINYLVGLGIDATTANQAVELYLSSQPLTTAQQADVNLAIGALGPPPSLPGPTTGSPPPVTGGGGGSGGAQVTVPKVDGMSIDAAKSAITAAGLVPKLNTATKGGTSYVITSQTPGAGTKVTAGSTVDLAAGVGTATSTGGGGAPTGPGKPGGPGSKPPAGAKTAPVPTGLVVSSKHSTSASVKWKAASGATGYEVTCTDQGTKRQVFASGTKTTAATMGGLTPSHTYQVDVASQPNSGAGAAHASVSFTTPRTG